MKKLLLFVAVLWAAWLGAQAQVTLDECLRRAEENYPLIKKFGLVASTRQLDLDEINRGWLPRVGVYAQATVQNAVPAYPEALTAVLNQLGREVEGLSRFQYKAGIEVSQTIWDGGASKSRRAVERAAAEETEAALAVELYGVRERVQSIYFGILLLQEQIGQARATRELLEANLHRMRSMVANGIAMQSDADMIEAQLLSVGQQIAEASSAANGYRALLEIYIAEPLDGRQLQRPSAQMPSSTESNRPELALFDKRLSLNKAREDAVGATLMPRVGFFGQVYYGYPGFNTFESMMKRDLSFNALAGVKVSWNIDALYTRSLSKRKLAAASDMALADRELFLFNNDLQATSERAAIKGVLDVMADDARIVELRSNVRRSAESQLENGVIDTTTLLAKITDENQARLNAAYHEIQYLQYIHQLKNTLNK